MNIKLSTVAAWCAVATLSGVVPSIVRAQEKEASSGAPSAWSWLKEGKVSAEARFRFEIFQRDGTQFTAPAYAPTLRLALGYQTPLYKGFSAYVQADAVLVTGRDDYNVPTLLPQRRPGRPVILDPRTAELSQSYLQWTHGRSHKNLVATVGRQEITLNDGRFLSISTWRQIHGSFDAAKLDSDLPGNFSITYAFINRVYRIVSDDASDGQPPMHTHLANVLWSKPGKVNVALYSLVADYGLPAQYALSTKTFGLRATGPYRLNADWALQYAAEFANQTNYGRNPNKVDANYYLGELGGLRRTFSFKAGYALLGGRSATDKLSTPLAHPFNGWTDLFVENPSAGGGHGLDARYLVAAGPVHRLDGLTATAIFYDYHSDSNHVHYGSELDLALAYKVKRTNDRWEIGWRFGRYWADHLFTPALRTSFYTSFNL